MRFIGNEKKIDEYIKSYGNDIQIKQIEFESIVFSPFVQLKCMNCGMFRRNYHCLASPNWKKSKEMLSKYNNFYLAYIIVDNKPRLKQFEEKSKELVKNGKRPLNNYIIKKFACGANQATLVSKIRKFLVSIKIMYPKENIKLYESGGGCRSCRDCGLVKPHKTGEPVTPCKKPRETFNAPESTGIDVYGTLKNNNIDFDVIPVERLITCGMVITK